MRGNGGEIGGVWGEMGGNGGKWGEWGIECQNYVLGNIEKMCEIGWKWENGAIRDKFPIFLNLIFLIFPQPRHHFHMFL